jgi:hypothetical protein
MDYGIEHTRLPAAGSGLIFRGDTHQRSSAELTVRLLDVPDGDEVTESAGTQCLSCTVCHGFGIFPRSGSRGRPRLCRHCHGYRFVLVRPGEAQHDETTCDCRFESDAYEPPSHPGARP